MPIVKAYAAENANQPLGPFQLSRREPGPRDVVIDILFCGVCHSDLHQVRNEWGNSTFPMVPGHEIVGRVVATGAEVTSHKAGDPVGVGCFVDSCRACGACAVKRLSRRVGAHRRGERVGRALTRGSEGDASR